MDIKHTNVYQVDHCITRANKHLFFATKNGTVVCSSCNRAKGFHNKSVARAIDQIVTDREGEVVFCQMVALDMKKHGNPDFGKRWWLETVQEDLERSINELRSSREH